MEPPQFAHLCQEGAVPWWCEVRQALIGFVSFNGFGVTSVVAAVTALLARSRAFATAALACGSAGLVLYSYDWSAVGFILGLLACTDQDQACADKHEQ